MKTKLFTLLFAFVASASTIWAYDAQIGYLYYNLKDSYKTAEVTYNSYSSGKYNEGWSITTANIPSSVTYRSTTYSVTRIGTCAFEDCTSLTSVTIGNGVTIIGQSAFCNCKSLTSVTIGNSVWGIEESAFRGCTSLTSVAIPNSVKIIGNSAFEDCTGLTSVNISDIAAWCEIDFAHFEANPLYYAKHLYLNSKEITNLVIPNSVTSIGDRAFSNCSGLTSVTIPNSVTSIGTSAFYNCKGLTSVTIPNSVTDIGYYAFDNCKGLTSVTIPNSVTSIGREAFNNCSRLTSIICYAVTPPKCYGDVWKNVMKSIPVYVPAKSVNAYKNANEWQYFTNILPIDFAIETASAEVKVVPSGSNSISVTWPEVSGATTYTIEIKKNGVVICTLTFNAEGILINKTFAAPARDGARNVASALQAGKGWTYTVAGLESNTEYTYTVIAKNAGGGVLLNQTVGFKTPLPDGIEDVVSDSGAAVKTLRNGQVLIQHAGKTYTLQGQEVK